ncbi:Alpha/Beta hydrolase protein [Xylaria sp. FL1777]|nr:Alpha/Beta hydrolase protein [Xylaria sp. FL1777]
MSSLKLNPEWDAIWQVISSMPKSIVKDGSDLRREGNAMLEPMFAMLPARTHIKETKHTIQSLDGTNINVHQFVPPAASSSPEPQRAILYAFGGGMVAGTIDIWRPSIKELADRTSTQVFAVDYRLAPEHPAPAAVEDFYAAAKWLQLHSAKFGVDPRRVVLHGKSAGGGIAAGTALLARDRGLPHPLAAMALTYPMLDDRTDLPADHPLHKYLIWTANWNDVGWAALLGREREERTDENVSIYAAPARAKDLSGLPDAFIEVGGLDLFRDEDTLFAARLANAGVHVEFHLYAGLAHGFDTQEQIKVCQEARSTLERFFAAY